MTKKQAAEYIGVSTSVATRLTNLGEITPSGEGSAPYTEEDIESYLESANLIRAPKDHPRDMQSMPKSGKPTVLSFFTGAGGLDLGLCESGFETVFHAENNRFARMSIEKNFPAAALAGDVASLTPEQVLDMSGLAPNEVDVMAGGPPCQAFSTAGARRGFDDPRGNIFMTYIDLASKIRPKYLVIENVRGLLSAPFPVKEGGEAVSGGALARVLGAIEDMGYSTSFNLYNAANYGVPQTRERVVIIASRDTEELPWLMPTHSNSDDELASWVNIEHAFSAIPDGTEHRHTQFSDKRLRYFEKLGPGQNWRDLPKEDQPVAMGKAFNASGGRTTFYRRLDWNKPSPTLVTSPTMPATDLCHPTELRPLSVEEYKVIQQFPLDYWVAGPVAEQYRQLGNAVPVGLGRAIGRALLLDMEGVRKAPPEGFRFSRYSASDHTTWSDPRLP